MRGTPCACRLRVVGQDLGAHVGPRHTGLTADQEAGGKLGPAAGKRNGEHTANGMSGRCADSAVAYHRLHACTGSCTLSPRHQHRVYPCTQHALRPMPTSHDGSYLPHVIVSCTSAAPLLLHERTSPSLVTVFPPRACIPPPEPHHANPPHPSAENRGSRATLRPDRVFTPIEGVDWN